MKKVFALMLVAVLFAGFAYGSYTETLATAGIPAVLTEIDQIIQTYPSRIMDFSNLAVVEYGIDIWGYTFLNTDMGVLGLAASPVPPMTVLGSGIEYPNTILTLMYGTNLSDTMKLGASILFGSDNETYEELDPLPAGIGKDTAADSEMYLAALLGLSMDVGMPLDVSIGIALPGNVDESKNYSDGANNILINNTKHEIGGLLLGINARTSLADWILNLGVQIDSMKTTDTNKVDGNTDGDFSDVGVDTDEKTEYEDAAMNISLLGGKQIKATETMIFTVGTGIQYITSQDLKYKYTDNLDPTNNSQENTNFYTSSYIIIPFWLSVNCKINETWSWMAGLSREILRMEIDIDIDQDANGDKTDEDKHTYLNTDNDISFAFGLTGQFGDLKLQWYMDQSLLLDGPYFISGNSSGWAFNVAIVYDWK